MAQISKAYTYKLPDSYYGTTAVDGNTATAIYNGPAKGFVFVGSDDGVLHPDEGFHPWNGKQDSRDAMETRAGISRRAILLDCATSDDDTIIASICMGQDISSEDWGTVSYTLDGETAPYHTAPDPLPFNGGYDVHNDGIKYDLENEVWLIDQSPFAKGQTMEGHVAMRDALITDAQEFLVDPENDELTEEQITAINAYITELQNLYTRFEGVHQMMIPYPSWPINDPGPVEEQAVAGADVGAG